MDVDEWGEEIGSSSSRAVKRARKTKAHFTKRNAKNLNPTIDVLEIIAAQCLHKTPLVLLRMMLTNKELYNQLMGNHDLWKRYYRKWETMLGGETGTGPFSKIELILPNLFGVPIKVDVRPPKKSQWWLDGIPEQDKLPFNKFVKKLLVMEHVPFCSQCGSSRYKVQPIWLVNKKLCMACLSGNLISDQVLAKRYGLKLDMVVNDYLVDSTEDEGYPMNLAGYVQDRVYYFQLQVCNGFTYV